MEKLIKDIEAFCEAAGITGSTFGTYAARDGKFYARIVGSGQCLPSTEARLRKYMAENPPETLRKRGRGKGRVAA